jgi:hypothetical protein
MGSPPFTRFSAVTIPASPEPDGSLKCDGSIHVDLLSRVAHGETASLARSVRDHRNARPLCGDQCLPRVAR